MNRLLLRRFSSVGYQHYFREGSSSRMYDYKLEWHDYRDSWGSKHLERDRMERKINFMVEQGYELYQINDMGGRWDGLLMTFRKPK